VIGLFVWLIEPRWYVIKFVFNKYTCGYALGTGYSFYVWIKNCENTFKLFQIILSVSCGFHAILCKNILSWIQRFAVQGLTILYLISCYNGLLYGGTRLCVCVFIYIYIYIYIYMTSQGYKIFMILKSLSSIWIKLVMTNIEKISSAIY